ncbi:hypothetical protein [Rossellomorea sp. DA94]|uniref:hypothetical protein n=1 Tax=Rossellomorea sp. DA94 TaxID=3038653 RepID=UPI00244AEFC2|nr:hypothetical protein [Rossellomorea sp. DA94]WGG44725.1 hypothetical protein P8596_18425 [Rossellomorea sp. DA94]
MIIEEGKINSAALILDNIDYEKDPAFVFLMLAHATEMKHHRFVRKILHTEDTVFKQKMNALDEYKNLLVSLSEALRDTAMHPVENLAVTKYFLDSLFLLISDKGSLKYDYQHDYLYSSNMICNGLKISKATLSRYVNLGLEVVDTNKHNRYPAHVLFYWKESLWSSRIQAIFQAFKIRNRTRLDIIKELEEEKRTYEKSHGNKSFYEVYAQVKNPDELEDPEKYYDWKDIMDELEELTNEDQSE